MLGKRDVLGELFGGRWGGRADTRHVCCACCVSAAHGAHRPISMTHGSTYLLLCSLYGTQVKANVLPLGTLLLPALLSCSAAHQHAFWALQVAKEVIFSVIGM